MSSLTNGLSSSPTFVRALARRPPLPPPHFGHHRRPLSRGHFTGVNSSPIMRSPSPCSVSSSASYRALSTGMRSPSVTSTRSRSQLGSPTFSTPPRRTYPRESTCSPATEEMILVKEQAPVVFDASLNFVLGCERQRVKQSFRPTASHLEPSTASSYLTSKISQFLKRTDHVMDEWRSLGHKDEPEDEPASLQLARDKPRVTIGRSQSATNIMIRGFQYYSRSSSAGKSPSRRSISRASEDGTLSGEGMQEVTQREEKWTNAPKDGSRSAREKIEAARWTFNCHAINQKPLYETLPIFRTPLTVSYRSKHLTSFRSLERHEAHDALLRNSNPSGSPQLNILFQLWPRVQRRRTEIMKQPRLTWRIVFYHLT